MVHWSSQMNNRHSLQELPISQLAALDLDGVHKQMVVIISSAVLYSDLSSSFLLPPYYL